MRARFKTKTKNKKMFRLGIIALAVLIVSGGALAYYMNRNSSGDQSGEQPESETVSWETKDEDTYDATSEGETIEVPESVSPDSIKDYELVTENEQYKIRRDRETGSYLITLYAIINHPDQYDYYQDQLREFKQKALNYLADQGVNVNAVDITYEPQEASQL